MFSSRIYKLNTKGKQDERVLVSDFSPVSPFWFPDAAHSGPGRPTKAHMPAAPFCQVITDKHIYRLDAKTFKLHKSPIALDQVTGFSISAGEDQAVVIHIGEGTDNDVVATLRGNACAAELVSLIAQQVDKSYVTHALCFPLCLPLPVCSRSSSRRVSLLCTVAAPSLPVNVNSKIYYYAQGKEVSLTFSEEEAKQTAFKRRGSGYALITRRASVMRLQVGRVRVWGE